MSKQQITLEQKLSAALASGHAGSEARLITETEQAAEQAAFLHAFEVGN